MNKLKTIRHEVIHFNERKTMIKKSHPLSLHGIFQNKMLPAILIIGFLIGLNFWVVHCYLWGANPLNDSQTRARVLSAIGGSCEDDKDKHRQLVDVGFNMQDGNYYVVCGDYDAENKLYTNVKNVGDWKIIIK